MTKEILLRSSWQDVNIGDIAHTPALLALLERYIPEASVTVWASPGITEEVIAMEHQRFPSVRFVKGSAAGNPEVRAAVLRADFFLHGSGPSLVGGREAAEYMNLTGRDFGVFGITYRPDDAPLLDKASFVYFRDSISLERARADGVHAPVMEFGPDAAFATDLRNDGKADAFLLECGLKPKHFVCCIPRLRITPYWKIKDGAVYNPESDALNNRFKEQDHRYLRAAIMRIIDETGADVLVCPEDKSQMAVGQEMILDKLPAVYRSRVVLRKNYWLTDEALSVYRRSLALFGNEMHSPIMCVGNHIPAAVCRWEQQTSKGFMWRDIGLGNWLFDSDAGIDDAKFADTILDMVIHQEEAVRKTDEALARVQALYKTMIGNVRRTLGL